MTTYKVKHVGGWYERYFKTPEDAEEHKKHMNEIPNDEEYIVEQVELWG